MTVGHCEWKDRGGYRETLTLRQGLAMANPTCRNCDRAADAGAYRCSCAAPALSPVGSMPTSRSQVRRQAVPAASGTLLDQQLAQGDVLVLAAVDRLGRRYLETMWAIYDLQRRGVRLRPLAGNEGEWTKFLDADPDSPEAFMANMAAYVASQERKNISRRTKAGLDAARAKGKELGRPRRLTE